MEDNHIASLIVDAKLSELVSVENWKRVTNRIIYLGFAKDFPIPKVEVESGVSLKQAWRRLGNPVLTSVSREILFLLLHNKLPVRERLFRIRLAVDPYCEHCFGSDGAIICDIEHFFCACSRVVQVWKRLKIMIANLLAVQEAHLSDMDLLNLRLPRNNFNNEVVWLIGNYVGKLWDCLIIRSAASLCDDQFFGFLKFKYRVDQLGSRLPSNPIQGLL